MWENKTGTFYCKFCEGEHTIEPIEFSMLDLYKNMSKEDKHKFALLMYFGENIEFICKEGDIWIITGKVNPNAIPTTD